MSLVEAENINTFQPSPQEIKAVREVLEDPAIPTPLERIVGEAKRLLFEASPEEIAQGRMTLDVDRGGESTRVEMSWQPLLEGEELAEKGERLRAKHQRLATRLEMIQEKLEGPSHPRPKGLLHHSFEARQGDKEHLARKASHLEKKLAGVEEEMARIFFGDQGIKGVFLTGQPPGMAVLARDLDGGLYQRAVEGMIETESREPSVIGLLAQGLAAFATFFSGFFPGSNNVQASGNFQPPATEVALSLQNAKVLVEEQNQAGKRSASLPGSFRMVFEDGGWRVVEEKSLSAGREVVTHVVSDGEYLGEIATRYGISVEDLLQANPWLRRNPNLIFPGQRLVIPVSQEKAVEATNIIVHSVQRGESLSSIALRFGVSPEEIARLNGIRNPDRIYVGQNLRIPVRGSGGWGSSPAKLAPFDGAGGQYTPPPPPTATPTPSSPPWAKVIAQALNLREGPRVDYPILDTLPQGTEVSPVCVVDQETKTLDDDWMAVQPEGKKEAGFVSAYPFYLQVVGRDRVPPCSSEAIPPTPVPPTPEPTERRIEGPIVEIIDEDPTANLALSSAWSEEDLRQVINKYKPGWKIRIKIVGSIEDLPRRWEGGPPGVAAIRHGRYLLAHWAEYNQEEKIATYYFYLGEGGKAQGPVQDGDKYADFVFTQEFFLFLYFSDPNWMLPGGLGSPPDDFVDHMTQYVGVPAYGSEKSEALFEWNF